MGALKWEFFLKKHIEGFFNRKFASELEVAEIEKNLEREILLKKEKKENIAYVPNVYTIYVSAPDYQRICSQRITDELYTGIEKQVIANDFFMEDKLIVSFMQNIELKKGMCDIKSFFRLSIPEIQEDKDSIESHTIVLERPSFSKPLNLPQEYKVASLTVVDGPDTEAYLEFGERPIYIGRREKNEFFLTDKNASRVHSYIVFEKHRHLLYDADSLNGTYVNGQKIKSQWLKFGDEIQVGNTIILYEVV